MSNKNLTIGVIVVLAILAGWYFLQSQKGQTPLPAPQVATEEASPSTSEATPSETMEKNVVKVSSSGFMPQNITIKAGESVTWMNEDSEDHQVNSAPHPTHTTYKPLNNVGLLKAGEKKSLSFPEAGTYKYHDHLNPSLTGSVTIE